jgi:hypothetical protein
MVAQARRGAETWIGRTQQGETVLQVPESQALLLTRDGVVALIRGLATSQNLTVVIDGIAAAAAPNLVTLRAPR